MILIKLVFSMIWLMVNIDLKKRTQSDKNLRDRTFKIATNAKNDGYQTGLASMTYKSFDKKSTESGNKNEIKQNQ